MVSLAITGDLPETTGNPLPEITEITGTLPEITGNLPEIYQGLPEIT